MKRSGPKTDNTQTCGLLFAQCWRSVRYDVNQQSAAPVIPVSARQSRSVVWEIVSNAVLRSRRMRMIRSSESPPRRGSLVM